MFFIYRTLVNLIILISPLIIIVRLIKKKEDSNLEDITPRRGYLRTDESNYKIVYDIYCFKKGKGATYIPNNAGLLWTLNGQTHAISKKELFRIDKLAFDIIAKDLLIVIDCTSIKGADREDFFKSSRDRLTPDSPIYKEIRQKLIDDLSEHTSLQELIEKRIDAVIKSIIPIITPPPPTIAKFVINSPCVEKI